MDLKQFIQQTIDDITAGIHQSHQNMIEAKTGRGIPGGISIDVEIDVAVTVSSDASSDLGGKVTVLGQLFQVGANQKQKDLSEHVSRIRFKVPILLNTLPASY